MSDPEAEDRGGSDSRRSRDHLANERTFLAWTRTAFAIMALGLALAKFGPAVDPEGLAIPAGIVLVVLGGAVLGYGLTRYRRVNNEIDLDDHTTGQQGSEITAVAVLLLLGVVATLVLLLV